MKNVELNSMTGTRASQAGVTAGTRSGDQRLTVGWRGGEVGGAGQVQGLISQVRRLDFSNREQLLWRVGGAT